MQSMKRNHSSSSSYVLITRVIIFVISCFIIIPIESKKNDGFSTELIHINSPISPFFKPKLIGKDLLNHTEQIESSKLIHDDSLYLMQISYGKPPVKSYHIVDTGGEISWIQCLPCIHCFPSKYSPFHHNKSQTFYFEKCSENETCLYNITYGDGTNSRGELARDTVTLGSGSHRREFKNFLFGCGHDNNGDFPHKAGGLVGFNHQPRSFITQLHDKHHGKFSYCMAPWESLRPGRISFGNEATVSGNGVMTTQLILDSFYNIMLDAITVGNKKLKYVPDSYLLSNDSDRENVQLKLVVDTGSNVLYLSSSFCSKVERSVQNHIKAKSPVGAQGAYKLCYSPSLRDADIPMIKLHFPGVVLELSPVNTFVPYARHRCLVMLASDNHSVLGNMAQLNFLVGLDLPKKKISFKPTNCARL